MLLALAIVLPFGAAGDDARLREYYARQLKRAKEGYPTDQYHLGIRYFKGDGVEKDEQLALRWIRAATTNANQEFPLSPALRKEAEATLSLLEKPNAPPLADMHKSQKAETITFTNLDGRVYQDINVLKVQPDAIFYVTSDGVGAGMVRFVDMPESLRAQFNYDPVKAAEYLRAAERASKERQAEIAKREFQLQIETLKHRSEDRLRQHEDVGGKLQPHEPKVVIRGGSGFFVTDDGYLLTCLHVVQDAKQITVKLKQDILPARLVQSDATNDLALLKVEGVFQALPVALKDSAHLGDSVFTVGFPNPDVQGIEPKFTDGKISGLAGIQDDRRYFQVSVAVQPGNSGGALVDQLGNVVGIMTMRLNDARTFAVTGLLPQNVNYALKSDQTATLLANVPGVASKLKKVSLPGGRKFEDVVKEAQDASVLVLAQ